MSLRSLRLRRPSPALVVATLALVVAMGGTASAVTMINGKNIKPNTVTGKQVKESSLATVPSAKSASSLSMLPSGKSESGAFSSGGDANTGAGGYLGAGITYARPLAKPIRNSHIIDVQNDAQSAPHCPGPGKADKGYLCLYDWISFDVGTGYGYSGDKQQLVNGHSVGVALYWFISGDTPYVGGTWTVTAG